MEIKINIGNPKDGSTTPLSLPESKALHGLQIGQEFKGELIDKTGYVFVITGGSDSSGFPMRRDVEGTGKKRVLLSGGVGFNPKRNGIRIRKTVSGNTVGEKTAQLNVRIVKEGKAPLVEAPAEESTPEEQ